MNTLQNIQRGGAAFALALALAAAGPAPAIAADVSPAPFLQMFEASWQTVERRTPDLFMAGYGGVWLPPPGRADSGDQSVGYDVYDRFDLGSPGDPTLYGTETGLKTVARTLDLAGIDLHADLVINHNGFSNQGTPGFLEAGGYPGFVLQDPDGDGDPFGIPGTDGDFNSAYDYGDLRGRLAGLIDINHGTNWRFIRHPVDSSDPRNIPAGTTPAFGRLANVADPNNRRFYPDRDLDPILVFDPKTGEQDIAIYPFNPDDPMAGDPVMENATGLLMRYAQWMVQVVGVDHFRIDAAKHVAGFTFGYFDRAVYRSNPRKLLDGSTQHVFSYGEVFDGNRDVLMDFVEKTIDPNNPGRVGANRDALDFALFFALRDNLTSNGTQNDWTHVVGAGMDPYDDGLHNGSAGVKFVGSHDEGSGPAMNNVAHAYTLLTPGNSVVYFNAHEFGDNRDFPKDGRGDALGGLYGDAITELLSIRTTHGRGNYHQRWLTKENLAFEREGSMLVMLSNRNDAGASDVKKIYVDLPFGTHLVELTGNAAANGLPQVLTVDDDFFEGPTFVNAKFLRNGGEDKGYLVYGLATPESQQGVELTNVAAVIEGGDPATGGGSEAYRNGTTRLTDLHVIEADTFDLTLATRAVTLPGGGDLRERDADGDNALFKIDGGLDFNANPGVDFVTPSPGSVVYGFEQFTDTHAPGYDAADGDGLYGQTIDATRLTEGMHFITVRAFRHRGDGGPAVFSDFKKVIYVDRLDPDSAVASFEPITEGVNENRTLVARSLDLTADNIHILFDLPAALTDQQVLALIGGGSQGDRLDRDLWARDVFGLTHGNHVATLVTFEITGNVNIQRFAGLFTSTIFGAGLGDTDFDGSYGVGDVGLFGQVLLSGDTLFNAAADFDGDGLIDLTDLDLLGDRLLAVGADTATMQAYDDLVSQVPEPASAAVLLIAAATLLRRSRRAG